jgi:hypothetical protein
MVLPAAPREALSTATFTFEHWSLEGADEPSLVAAESSCREVVGELLTRLPAPSDPRSADECDAEALAPRLEDPDAWSDVGVRPELSDMVTLHTGPLMEEADVAAARDDVGREFVDALRRRGWCPPGTGWANSGHLWYRAGAVLGWHTNTRYPGWRAYLSWVAEPGHSFFRYRDPVDGEVVTSWDTGLDLRLFHVSVDNPLWHCVWAGADRHSFGYRLVDTEG